MYFKLFVPDEAREEWNIALSNYCLTKLHLRCAKIVLISLNILSYNVVDQYSSVGLKGSCIHTKNVADEAIF